MVDKATTAVWQPPTDGPVGRDFDVRVNLAVQAGISERLPRSWSVCVFVALLCLADRLWVSAALALAAALVLSGNMLRYWALVGRWRPATLALLESEPARSVDYEPVTRRLVRIDGTVLRVHPNYQNARLWLVGPNADGFAVLFYGSRPFPRAARVVVRPPRRSGPPPRSKVRDPLWRARLIRTLTAAALALRWTVIVGLTVSVGLELAPQPHVLAWMLGVAGVLILILLVRNLRRSWPSLRLPALISVPLVEHRARLMPKRTVAVTLADGSELVGRLIRNQDVTSSVRASGRLWIAGTPAAGATLGVGVPDFPIVGAVRFDK
ncbi:hypothetical protein KUTG_05049 [Kutzneria sp. 744]|nr:hypothetical protein KUTG_05049 [Kutzneria sp. 744]